MTDTQWDLEEMLQSLQEAIQRVPATGARLSDRLALQRSVNRVQRDLGGLVDTLRNIPELEETVLKLQAVQKDAQDLLAQFDFE